MYTVLISLNIIKFEVLFIIMLLFTLRKGYNILLYNSHLLPDCVKQKSVL